MFARRVYYQLKPTIPRRLRLLLRSFWSRRIQESRRHVWPILESASRRPVDWNGWPEGREFAVVLTHDVEGARGLARVRQLAELEKRYGFRSAFNFIPEGDYEVSAELRGWLTDQGFEVGVHDLHHNGKLFSSRRRFQECAPKINRYLKEWKAAGFRAGFMHHNLEWIHDLNIQYDCSTFDTDPFEPQPDGVETIFPFWIPSRRGGTGYVELPYTLPQDSTLFLLLGHRNIDVWTRKLAWIARHGGMALLDSHPDYMSPEAAHANAFEPPMDLYARFLAHLRSEYDSRFWHGLPREVAGWVSAFPAKRAPDAQPLNPVETRHQRIWIDLDNTPHVAFFEPIIEELQARGHGVLLTARDAFQVCELAERKALPFIKVGRHHGRNLLMKFLGLCYRTLQLAPVVLHEKPALGVSHGSRSQLMLCNLLGLPTVLLDDYEHSRYLPSMRPTWAMIPDVIPVADAGCPPERVRKYRGLKEDFYVGRLKPDPSILDALGLCASDIVVTARPPADEAHYHSPESDTLFRSFMERACDTDKVRVVLLPRNQRQGAALRTSHAHWFENGRTVIPPHAVDGLNLLWHSDLVVSGGGTMNREAAALGVPVYSLFRGELGAVDRALEQHGRLVMLRTPDDVRTKICFVHRDRSLPLPIRTSSAVGWVADQIESILRSGRPADGATPSAAGNSLGTEASVSIQEV